MINWIRGWAVWCVVTGKHKWRRFTVEQTGDRKQCRRCGIVKSVRTRTGKPKERPDNPNATRYEGQQ